MAMEMFENEVVENEVVETVVNETTEAEAPETETGTKRDPLAKYNELSEDRQEIVNGIVDTVLDSIGGADNIDLALLLGVLDKLNAEKKTARELAKAKEKEQKALAKEEAASNGEKIKAKIKEGDSIDTYMSTAKVTILDAKVLKVTEKSVRIDVTKDTKVLYKGKETTAGEVSGLKLGKKSVAFAKITKVNAQALADYLAA